MDSRTIMEINNILVSTEIIINIKVKVNMGSTNSPMVINTTNLTNNK